MFHRRRASSNPPAKTPPTAAASTAAVQAFLASRNSNANLSSAAAAAALRSRPTTPTPVGDIPTKRRAQRSGSVSSNGSARPTLQRQNSSGSMTERTFRDPSPSRNNAAYLYTDDPPPVPALPRGYASPPPIPARSLQRPASVEPPERVTSPVPRAGGRGVSLDRGPGIGIPKQPKKIKTSPLDTVGEARGTPNRESVNFSRPMSPTNSPPVTPLREPKLKPALKQVQSAVPTANMGALRAGEADNIQHAVQEAAARPVKKKKKVVAKDLVEGSHFAGGGGAKPIGSAVETPTKPIASTSSTPSPANAKSTFQTAPAPAQPAPKKKKKRVVSSESSQGSYASDSDSAMSDRSSSTDRPRVYHTRAAGLLAKQPSIVREDREAEEQEVGEAPKRRIARENGDIDEPPKATVPKAPAIPRQHKKSASQPPALSTSQSKRTLDVPSAYGAPDNNAHTAEMDIQQQRRQSLSPGRAAHFSAQPTYETPDGIKHQPPARSVSPAKSALKHSPSSRGASPVGFASGHFSRLPGAAGSEASDNGSVVSDEGDRLRAKKKSARVSFDEDSVILGRASTPPATDSPTILSPQHKDGTSKGFLGFGRRSKLGGLPQESEQNDAMEPTPTLPSFGSIKSKSKGQAEPTRPRSDDQSVPSRPLLKTQTSSDHAIGQIISHDLTSWRNAPLEQVPDQQMRNEPLPPDVTSVEGTGYHSDDEESARSDMDEARKPVNGIKVASVEHESATSGQSLVSEPSIGQNKTQLNDGRAEVQNGGVPSIAILPATPGIGSGENDGESWFRIPGQFDEVTGDNDFQPSAEEDSDRTGVHPSLIAEHHATDPTPAALGISEPEPESTTNSRAPSPIVGHIAESIQQQSHTSNEDESDDTGNSIYSDAAEDAADFDGDGFGSINAIMESPVIPRTPFVAGLIPESPKTQTSSPSAQTARPNAIKRNESELSEPAPEEGWDRAQAYWSGLSQSRKQQLERAAGTSDEASDPLTETKDAPVLAPEEKPKKKKMVKKKAQPSEPPLPPWPDREFQQEVARPSSPRMGQMKQSMRPSQPNESQPHLRTSMRDRVPPKSALRNSVPPVEPESAPRGGLKKKSRPASAIVDASKTKINGKAAANHGRAASVGITPKTTVPLAPLPKKTPKPALRRATSDGSDSSSSFKKSRPTTSDGGKYTMKRTMRGSSTDGRAQSPQAKRQPSVNVRSTSPPTRRPFSSGGSGMRTSMRESTDSSRTKSPSRGFSFGRSSQPKQAPKKTGSRLVSRFGDSSDEDDAPVKRKSRFVDSSDEEDNAALTPVRGIPRRTDEGDSTDLEDSSASPSPNIQAMKSEKPQLSLATNGAKPLEGSALATGSLRAGSANKPAPAVEKEKKKRSFFGGLGGGSKKQSSQPPTISPPIQTLTTHPLEANYASPVTTPSSPRSPKASKLLGNSPVAATAASASATASPKSQASPKPPKLQRRNTPKRLTSDSWPLPEMPPVAEKERPNTSDGAGAGGRLATGTLRPETGKRRFTAEPAPINGAVGGGGGGAAAAVAGAKEKEKKKRFPMLRKALGLKDG
ncbi:MAG: hypothetical protein Q9220_000234 [cf. Caloplaca sp. 1 TL-2023]